MRQPTKPTCSPCVVAGIALAAYLGVAVPVPVPAFPLERGAAADSAGVQYGSRLLAPGTIVRLRTPPRDEGGLLRTPAIRRGWLVWTTADSLWFAADSVHLATPVALGDVQRLEIMTGRSHLGGALVGAGAGFMSGFLVGLVAASVVADLQHLDHSDSGLMAAVFTLGGVAVGTSAGAAIGGIRGLDRWETVR